MNEKTENSETCLRLKQGYTETGPQPVPHGIATGRREIWVLALQPSATPKLCTMHSERLEPCTEQQLEKKKIKVLLKVKTVTDIFNLKST